MDATKFNTLLTDLPDGAIRPHLPTESGGSKLKYKRSQMIVTEMICSDGDQFAVGRTAEELYVAFFGANAYVAADLVELNGVLNHVERALLPQ